MTGIELAIIAFALMLLAIFLRLPIGLAMGLTGFFGIWYMMGRPSVTLSQLKTLSYDTFSSYSLSIVPLFLLMGQFATKSGMSGRAVQRGLGLAGAPQGAVWRWRLLAPVPVLVRFVARRWQPRRPWGQVALPRDAQAWLFRCAVDRRSGRRWYAGHPDPHRRSFW